MEVDVLYRPSYAVARVRLAPNEALNAESGAMVGMSAGTQVETKMRGGVLKSLTRSMLGGESFFINTFRGGPQGGEVLLAPSLPGDISVLPLQGHSLLVQSGSYLGSSEGIAVDTKWGGAKTFFAGEGLFMLKCAGTGTLILSSYGAIHELVLAEGQSYTVDTGHLVAFSETMRFNIRSIGGLKSLFFSGEGLVVDLYGPGKVLLQTRSVQSFLSWIISKIPKSSSS